MEMDMSEPGEMCCCGEGEHKPANTDIPLLWQTRQHTTVSRIVVSGRPIDQSC